MANETHLDWKVLVDRQMLTYLRACAACGRKFNLGEPVVLADGAWEGPPRWIHEEEAEFDPKNGRYVESRIIADKS